jgi:DNA-binding NtrC family response regulator
MATLLIVDDDPVIREILSEVLTNNYECHTADRAEQALAYLALETYDAVITDISMPGLSGEEVLKRVKLTDPNIPVIVMSGELNEDSVNNLMALGAFACVAKPFQMDSIEKLITTAISQKESEPKTSDSEP